MTTEEETKTKDTINLMLFSHIIFLKPVFINLADSFRIKASVYKRRHASDSQTVRFEVYHYLISAEHLPAMESARMELMQLF